MVGSVLWLREGGKLALRPLRGPPQPDGSAPTRRVGAEGRTCLRSEKE